MAYRSHTALAYGGRFSTVVNKPAGAAAGDICAIAVFIGATWPDLDTVIDSNWTPPTGFVLKKALGDDGAGGVTYEGVGDNVTGTGGFHAYFRVYWKRLDGSEGSTFTFAHGGNGANTAAVAVCFDGRLASGDPIEAIAETLQTAIAAGAGDADFPASTSGTFNGIATTTNPGVTASAGADLCWFAFDWEGTSTIATPSGGATWSERNDNSIVYLATSDNAGGGATGTISQVNGNPVANPWGTFALSIAPAAGGGGGDVTGTMAVTEGADSTAFSGEVLQDWDFLGVSNVVTVSTTGHTLVTTGIGPALQENDLLIACIGSRIASATPVTLPSGGEWNLVGQQNTNNILTTTGAIASGTMAYCKRGASNPNFAFTHPVAAAPAMGRIIAYRPKGEWTFDVGQANTTGTNTTSVSTAGLSTAAALELLVRMAVGGQEAAWSAFDATDPTTVSGATNADATVDPIVGTWTERADSSTTTGNDMSLAIADAIKSGSGATGNLTATASLGAGHVQITGAFRIIGRTGTMAVTEGADTASMAGTVEQGRTGTMAATEGADVAAASGLVRITGTLAATDRPDGTAFSGLVRITGTMAATEGADGTAATGLVRITGTMAATDRPDVAAIIGTLTNSRTGTLAATEGADSAAATGTVRVSGTMAATDRPDVAAASGLVRVTGTLSAIEGADSAAAAGGIQTNRTGTLAAVDGADLFAAVGRVIGTGTILVTEGADVASFVGSVRVSGIVNATEGADLLAATGKVLQSTGPRHVEQAALMI